MPRWGRLGTAGDGWGRLGTTGDGWGRLGTTGVPGDGWGRLGTAEYLVASAVVPSKWLM
jgi:hypothetical protein